MTGAWLIVKWIVAAAGLCSVILLLIAWARKGSKFFREEPWQKIFFGFVIANFLPVGLAGIFENAVFTRFCFVVAGVIYTGIAVVLLKDLPKKREGSLKADS